MEPPLRCRFASTVRFLFVAGNGLRRQARNFGAVGTTGLEQARVSADGERREEGTTHRRLVRRATVAGPDASGGRRGDSWNPRRACGTGRGMGRIVSLPLLALVFWSAAGCSPGDSSPSGPGLGEIMTLTQMRHAKLWFAGDAGNWPLAAYELDELREGFDDSVRYHPTHKDAPVRLDEVLPKLTRAPLEQLDAAVSQQDLLLFTAAYDALTASCNACHQAMQFGFNVVRRPVSNPYGNQSFAVPASGNTGSGDD